MENIILIILLIAIIGFAVIYIYKEKKNGAKCIGCPHAKNCRKESCDGCIKEYPHYEAE